MPRWASPKAAKSTTPQRRRPRASGRPARRALRHAHCYSVSLQGEDTAVFHSKLSNSVIALVRRHLRHSQCRSRIDLETHLFDDLGFDSLQFAALIADLERHFDFEISGDDLAGIQTVASAARLVAAHRVQGGRPGARRAVQRPLRQAASRAA
jgi:acyl carrier protein